MDTAGGTAEWCATNGGNYGSDNVTDSSGVPWEPCVTSDPSSMHRPSGTDYDLTLAPPVPNVNATLRADHAMHDGVDGDSDVGTDTNEGGIKCNTLGSV